MFDKFIIFKGCKYALKTIAYFDIKWNIVLKLFLNHSSGMILAYYPNGQHPIKKRVQKYLKRIFGFENLDRTAKP